MKNILFITGLMVLTADVVIGLPGPIDWNAVTHIKRLNYSPALPIDLYSSQGVNLDHAGTYFGARTLYRLGADPVLTEYEQKKLRNEICASNLMYRAGDANQDIPGSLGVYLHEDRIISVSDTGITGERLDSVLRKLSRENNDTKIAIAKYYATAMVRNLILIHAGGITWNSLDLRNFYTRPNGGLYAVDFSEAKIGDAAAQAAEFKDFATRVVRDMYMILFPDPAQAQLNYLTFVGGPNPRAGGVVDSAAAVTARVAASLSNAAGNLNLLSSGIGGAGWNAANALAYLTHPQNIPAIPSVAFPSILKAHHDGAAANQMIYDNVTVGQFINLLPGIPANAAKAVLCNGWTGNE